MDFAKHKQEMEELKRISQIIKDNPGVDPKTFNTENYKVVSVSGRSLKEDLFEYNRLRELAEYINRNFDAFKNGELDSVKTKEFAKYRSEYLEMVENLPDYIDKEENFLNMLHSVAKGLTVAEGDNLRDALENCEHASESKAMWRAEPFCDTLYNVKYTHYVEFSRLSAEHACSFSFTDKVLYAELPNDFQDVINDFGTMDKFDIDNILLLVEANRNRGWDGKNLAENNKWQIPAGFEDTFIQSVKDTGYSFEYYEAGPELFIPPFREVGMDRIADFLETRIDERLIPREQ
jgi:hypothetical protein